MERITGVKEITAVLKKKLKASESYNVSSITDRLSLLLRKIANNNHFYIGISAASDTTTINIAQFLNGHWLRIPSSPETVR